MIIVIIMSAAAALLPSCNESSLAEQEMKKFTPVETGLIDDSFFAVRGKISTMFLVQYADGAYIAIDAGDDKPAVSDGLDELDIAAESVSAVFLTHSDWDHIKGLSLFENATVYISEEEDPVVKGTAERKKGIRKKADIGIYKMLSDDESLQFGNTSVRIINTPGHTPGSASYLVNGTLLFSGDTIAYTGGVLSVFPRVFNTDHAMTAESMLRLSELSDITIIFTPHHGVVFDAQMAFAEWKESRPSTD